MSKYTVVTGALLPLFETKWEIEAWDFIEEAMRNGDTRQFSVLDSHVEIDPEIRAYMASKRHHLLESPL